MIEIEHPREITARERSKHRLLPGERRCSGPPIPSGFDETGSFVEDFAGLSALLEAVRGIGKVRA